MSEKLERTYPPEQEIGYNCISLIISSDFYLALASKLQSQAAAENVAVQWLQYTSNMPIPTKRVRLKPLNKLDAINEVADININYPIDIRSRDEDDLIKALALEVRDYQGNRQIFCLTKNHVIKGIDKFPSNLRSKLTLDGFVDLINSSSNPQEELDISRFLNEVLVTPSPRMVEIHRREVAMGLSEDPDYLPLNPYRVTTFEEMPGGLNDLRL